MPSSSTFLATTGGVVLALCLVAPPAQAFVLYPVETGYDWYLRWDWPADSTSNSGLGGGLDFAIDIDFCDHVLPKFKEEKDTVGLYSFVNCKRRGSDVDSRPCARAARRLRNLSAAPLP